MWIQLLPYLFSVPITPLHSQRDVLHYLSCLDAWTRSTINALNLSSCVTASHFLKQYRNLNLLSIAYDHPVLGLGPDLPWADEPSPGNLRFPAGGILTLLIVYSYQHSHFCTLH